MSQRGLLTALAYGFVVGLLVGTVLEASGALAGLDRIIGRRLNAGARRETPEERAPLA